MSIKELIVSPKLASTTASTTIATGLGTILELIPDDIGKLATVVGIILSLILSYVHILNAKKSRLELKILEKKLEEQ